MKNVIALSLLAFALRLAPAVADDRLLFIALNAEPDPTRLTLVVPDDEDKRDVRNLCQRKGKLWVWPGSGPFSCAKVDVVGLVDTMSLKVTPQMPVKSSLTSVVSDRPFPAQRWTLRKPDAAELKAAERLSRLKGDDRRLLKSGAVKVLAVAQGGREFLVLPFQRKREAVQHKIFRSEGKRWKEVYASDGAPSFFGDLDGDGIPEIKRTPYCGGSCEYYESFYPTAQVLLEWSVHG